MRYKIKDESALGYGRQLGSVDGMNDADAMKKAKTLYPGRLLTLEREGIMLDIQQRDEDAIWRHVNVTL